VAVLMIKIVTMGQVTIVTSVAVILELVARVVVVLICVVWRRYC
jgi:hypothetical protein